MLYYNMIAYYSAKYKNIYFDGYLPDVDKRALFKLIYY